MKGNLRGLKKSSSLPAWPVPNSLQASSRSLGFRRIPYMRRTGRREYLSIIYHKFSKPFNGVVYGCFTKIGVPQNGWFIVENPIKMHDFLGGNPLFSETSIYSRPIPAHFGNLEWARMPRVWCMGRSGRTELLFLRSAKGWNLSELSEGVTLPQTNIALENRPSQKESSLPTIHFQVLC